MSVSPNSRPRIIQIGLSKFESTCGVIMRDSASELNAAQLSIYSILAPQPMKRPLMKQNS